MSGPRGRSSWPCVPITWLAAGGPVSSSQCWLRLPSPLWLWLSQPPGTDCWRELVPQWTMGRTVGDKASFRTKLTWPQLSLLGPGWGRRSPAALNPI